MNDGDLPATLITTYLEMTSRDAFRPAYVDDRELTILPVTTPDLEYYLFLYSSVGAMWRWRDRLLMNEAELQQILEDARTSWYVLYCEGVPAGYIELFAGEDSTEVAYFGLRPAFTGRGLGKHLLSVGVAKAWDDGAARVWVHTCNLDHPHAIANYEARGFRIYDVKRDPMPERFR